jgi:exodeoxyribonuclease V gamma subunit
MAFYLYQHYDLNYLAAQLQRLRCEGNIFGSAKGAPFRSKDIFVPETLVVPTYGMRIWLSQYLAQQGSVVANIVFPYPRNFIDEILRRHFAGRDDYRPELFSVEVLTWRIMAILESPAAQKNKELLAPLLHYLEQQDSLPELRCYELASRLAGLFDQYQVYRHDKLVAWGDESSAPLPEAERWQAWLWRQLLRDEQAQPLLSQAQAFGDFIETGSANAGATPVAVFGISTLPPVYVQILLELAKTREVHFFYHNPCMEYIGDHPVRREKRPASELDDPEHFNPLIENYGLLARDFSNVILDLSGAYEEPDDYAAAAAVEQGAQGATLLAHLQSSVIRVRQPEEEQKKISVPTTDDSLLFFDCHNALRQVEVLHDRLLELFDRNVAAKRGERLYPDDILVMAPDIGALAPTIAAVFEQGPLKDYYAVSDRSLQQSNAIAAAFASILDLVDGRFERSRVMALLEVAALRRRFHFAAEEVERLQNWIYQAYVCWGIDREHRQQDCGIPFDAFSWRQAINRIMLGMALEDVSDEQAAKALQDAAEPRPLAGGPQWLQSSLPTWQERMPPLCLAEDGDGRALLGKFSAFFEKLVETAELLRKPRPIDEWHASLKELLTEFFAPDNRSAADYAVLRQTLKDIATAAKQAGYDKELPYELIKRLLQTAMETPLKSYPFMSGKITFCSLQPMRSVPRRVIAMLGMDDGSFPRVDNKLGFNIMVQEYVPGDRSRQWEDRYLFLESIMAAQDRLWIFYNGRSESRKRELVPALPVCELRDVMAQSYAVATEDSAAPGGADILGALTIMTPLHPYDPDCYGAATPGNPQALFSYNERYCAIANELASNKARPSVNFLEDMAGKTFAEPSGRQRERLYIRDLVNFYSNASELFMTRALGFPGRDWGERRHDDLEPLTIDHKERSALCRRLAQYQKRRPLCDEERARLLRRLQAENCLPPGAPGQRLFDECLADSRFADPGLQAIWAAQETAILSCELAQLTLSGTVSYAAGPPAQQLICLFRDKGEVSDYYKIDAYIRHLFILAAGEAEGLQTSIYASVKDDKPLLIAPITPEEAKSSLAGMIDHYFSCLRYPTPLPARNHLALVRKKKLTVADLKENAEDLFFGHLYSEEQINDEEFRERFAAKSAKLLGVIEDSVQTPGKKKQ